jgi:hypothetical protein
MCYEKEKASAIVEAITSVRCGKWKMILLLAFLVLCVLKMALSIGNQLKVKAIFWTYKSNENTTDLTS